MSHGLKWILDHGLDNVKIQMVDKAVADLINH